jgi:hypothetical protein
MAAGLAVAALTGALVMLAFVGRRSPQAASAGPVPVVEASPATSASDESQPAPGGAVRGEGDGPDASVSSSGSSASASSGVTSKPVVSNKAGGRPSPRNCNPPYVDDPQTGKRKWKQACLRGGP